MPNRNPVKFRAKLGVFAAFAIFAFAAFWGGSASVSQNVAASAFGPTTGHTGAPGEMNCTACHTTFPVNSGKGSVTISGLPLNYLPGQQIPVTVTVSDPEGVNFGFQSTAIDSFGARAGEMLLPDTMPAPMLLQYGLIGMDVREYISHTVDGIVPTVPNTKSWQFIWSAPERRVGKVGFYAAGNAANGTGGPGNDLIYTTSASTFSGTNISSFDGDTVSEPAVYRPSNGHWYSANSTDGQEKDTWWGVEGDVPVPGDYDGDGTTDLAVYRESAGYFYIVQSSGDTLWVPWGVEGDIPVPADYDGDLKTDVAVYRPSDGYWYILYSGGGVGFIHWGVEGDIVVPADYDGDAKTDVAVYRPWEGIWYVMQSSDGFMAAHWGVSTDRPMPADYDGDGRADIAVVRESEAVWYIVGSRNGDYRFRHWGVSTDVPAPADFDGDGSVDVAIFRDGQWWAILSSNDEVYFRALGGAGDTPIPTAYFPNGQ